MASCWKRTALASVASTGVLLAACSAHECRPEHVLYLAAILQKAVVSQPYAALFVAGTHAWYKQRADNNRHCTASAMQAQNWQHSQLPVPQCMQVHTMHPEALMVR